MLKFLAGTRVQPTLAHASENNYPIDLAPFDAR